ncbi:DUF222 domain-containing protein [Amnibacterium sp. CER49]|uniref:HNH endonuclease signature motif containing protein n=1 Tax=Amnibacterium sp. CER49 TaxID=3039161 RepID=UPI002448F553|nr:HNH endonuclease signature motif containing protein [Amnibacterium sp. CER49]MDH2444431.1 DUF222 domain-containing protein [Amnibacterium sp. CER49]
MESTARVRQATDVLRITSAADRRSTDRDLLADAQAWEELGRLVDARRLAVAAEVEWRSRPGLGSDGLAAREEQKGGKELLAERLLISTSEAKRRISLGSALAPRWSFTDEPLPGRAPMLADAVQHGTVPLESARLILVTLDSARRRAADEDLEAAEALLTNTARTAPVDVLAVVAQMWTQALDPDGAEPDEKEQRRKESLKLGRLRLDGSSTLSAVISAETRAEIEAFLNAHRRGTTFVRNPDDGEDLEWHEAAQDGRTRAQHHSDALWSAFRAGVRAEQEGTGGSPASPHEVITVITIDELERRQGAGHPDGVLARFSVPTVERLQCSGTSRLLVTDLSGEPLALGRRTRLFSAAQKKALAGRDGGCAWPGCTAPSAWCEAHHIAWWNRDGGATDLENGVLLCSHHHHLIDEPMSRWQIVIHHHERYLVPQLRQGDPLPKHRMQRHRRHVRGRPATEAA